jgi:hypothetical protein
MEYVGREKRCTLIIAHVKGGKVLAFVLDFVQELVHLHALVVVVLAEADDDYLGILGHLYVLQVGTSPMPRNS